MSLYYLFPLLLSIATPQPPKQPTLPAAPRHENPTGAANYGLEKIDSVNGVGLIKLNGTEVTDLHLNGSLLSKDAIILGTLTIQGEANLRDTKVNGETNIIGSIRTQNSSFQKPVTVHSQKAIFTKTSLDSLTIRQEPSYKGKQIIELKQGTVVKGSIHFESGKGEVHIDPSSRIEGKVSGGKIIKRNF